MPTQAIDNLRECSDHATVRWSAPTLLILLLALCLTACTVAPAPNYPRPALRHSPSDIKTPDLVNFIQHENGRSEGMLMGEGERVRFELRRAPRASHEDRVTHHESDGQPLVLLVPILAGGSELMGLVAQRLVSQGFDVAFCERAGRALVPPQRGPDLDELFRRTVLHQRLLLTWLRQADSPPSSLHVLGLSMGGIISTVLAATETDLCGIAICLAGANLAELLLTTSESRVHDWLDWRQTTDGIGRDGIYRELARHLSHEPARFAPHVSTERVLFVSAAWDTVVPRPNQSLLWEGLGRPQRLDVPFGHYSSAIALERVINACAAHFRAHCH